MHLQPEGLAFEIAFGAYVLAHAVQFAVDAVCRTYDDVKARIRQSFGKNEKN